MNLTATIWATLMLCMTLSVQALARESGGPLILVQSGKSDYRIVISKTASFEVKMAAEELRDFIKQISGAELPIATDDQPMVQKEIILGRNRHLSSARTSIDFKKLGDEGFVIRTAGLRLVIAGGPVRGTLYGVYTFLEDHLGCRWYTPKASFVPTKPDIVLGKIDSTQVPAMVWRFVYYDEARDAIFALRQKIDSNPLQGITTTIDRQVESGNGWCHTMFTYLPPDKYFASHPEYFALRDGKRQATQPCLSNPDVLRIIVENLKAAIAANPKAKYWNISQMDNPDYCTCDQCKAIDDREGSPAGSVLTFVNKVAAEIPDKTISTLAYWYTLPPPKTIRPAKNVHIMLCHDWSPRDQLHSYYLGWSKISRDFYVWHYVIPCHNMIAPWPNLRLLPVQIKEAVTTGARGMFVEGIHNSGSEFAELRTYILAKLLWNPDINVEPLIDDFLRGYYGAAGPIMRRYIDSMHDSLIATNDTLDSHDWSSHHAGTFLAPVMLAKYDAIFDEAEKAVATDTGLLLRVQHARMPLMHAELQLGYGTVDSRIALTQHMLDVAKRSNTPYFWDFNNRPTDQYLAGLLDGLNKEKSGQH